MINRFRTSLLVSRSNTLLFGATVLLAASLPFEFIHPILVAPPLRLNNVSLIIVMAGLIWLVHLILRFFAGIPPKWSPRQTVLRLAAAALMFLLAAFLAAYFAPLYRGTSLRFVVHFVAGIQVFFLTIYIIDSHQRALIVVWVIVIGAAVSAAIGLAEIMVPEALGDHLLLFKTAPSRVGGTIRLSSTFQYTTIASMYYEMTVPLGLVLAARAANRTSRRGALLSTLICVAAIILTLTRSGMAVVFILGIIFMGLGLWRFRSLVLPTVIMITALIIVVGIFFSGSSTLRARLRTESDLDWYNATYNVPARLTLDSGSSTRVDVEVVNTGEVEWTTSGDTPYKLAYYWVSLQEAAPLDRPQLEAALPHIVFPGESVTVEVDVVANLPPGQYHLVWGMLQSNIVWFRHRGVPEANTLVEIMPSSESDAALPLITSSTPPGGNMDQSDFTAVSRLDLWRAALMMWRERPLLGVGPDNFRLRYGAYLGFETWYQSNHANNLYLEFLATMGILGFATFFWFVLLLLKETRQLLETLFRGVSSELLPLGLAGSLAVFFLHGMVDYFLPFVPTLGIFWLVAGLIVALRHRTDPPNE